MRIWIDLSNSPHAPLFGPISRRLEELGCDVEITARDNSQTVELARQRWADVEVIGGPSPPGRVAKAGSLVERARRLAAWAREAGPEVAISHNSYAQLVAARALGIRAVTAMDYEHQPANHLAFRLAHTVILPGALTAAGLRRKGAAPRKTRFYDGFKEEIYLGDFTPDPGILAEVGAERLDSVLVVARTPPAGALYHRADNPLFVRALDRVARTPGTRCVVLARGSEQRRAIAELGLPDVVLPDRALDARSLIHAADLVIGAGGTMTREAALLGVPTLSLFAGPTPAVDRRLEERGALRRVRSLDDLPPVQRRPGEPRDPRELRARSAALVEEFVGVLLEARETTRLPPVTAEARG